MSEIIKQIKDRYKIDLECQGIKYELWRIDDEDIINLYALIDWVRLVG